MSAIVPSGVTETSREPGSSFGLSATARRSGLVSRASVVTTLMVEASTTETSFEPSLVT